MFGFSATLSSVLFFRARTVGALALFPVTLLQLASASVSQSVSPPVDQSFSRSVGRLRVSLSHYSLSAVLPSVLFLSGIRTASTLQLVRQPVGRSVTQSVHRSVSQSVSQSIRPSVSQSIRPSVSQSIRPSVSQSVVLSAGRSHSSGLSC